MVWIPISDVLWNTITCHFIHRRVLVVSVCYRQVSVANITTANSSLIRKVGGSSPPVDVQYPLNVHLEFMCAASPAGNTAAPVSVELTLWNLSVHLAVVRKVVGWSPTRKLLNSYSIGHLLTHFITVYVCISACLEHCGVCLCDVVSCQMKGHRFEIFLFFFFKYRQGHSLETYCIFQPELDQF